MPKNKWFVHKNYKWFINEARPKTEKILSETGFSIEELNEVCDSVERIAKGSYSDPDMIAPWVAGNFGSDRLEHVVYWIVREATDVWEGTYTPTKHGTLEYESRPKIMGKNEILKRIERGVHKYKGHIPYRLLSKVEGWRNLDRKSEATTKLAPAKHTS